ncbi:MAG: CRISPR-associated protein Cas4 [Clostridiales bacterium]|jgi:CRISPR-associated exonuclease Cas4|nr:CRISPR-associated protein Cas4 [Clostridiales bacterium]
MQKYEEEDYLAISGFQHFMFCRRQWALIHIENQWEDNWRTTDGEIMHKRAHDNTVAEKRSDIITVNGLKISSKELGISGECDSVQFFRDKGGVYLAKYKGTFLPYPVEYKRGKGQSLEADTMQLCAQAICLEEMLCCKIEKGALFYGEPHRRTEIVFTDELKERVKQTAKEMHEYYDRKTTPKAIYGKPCAACSLKELCLPKLGKPKKSVGEYLRSGLDE